MKIFIEVESRQVCYRQNAFHLNEIVNYIVFIYIIENKMKNNYSILLLQKSRFSFLFFLFLKRMAMNINYYFIISDLLFQGNIYSSRNTKMSLEEVSSFNFKFKLKQLITINVYLEIRCGCRKCKKSYKTSH